MKRLLSLLLAVLCLVFSACGRPESADMPPITADDPAEVPESEEPADGSSGAEEPESPDSRESPPPKAAFSLELLKSFSMKDYLITSAKLTEDEVLITRMPAGAGVGFLPGSEAVSIDRETGAETVLGFRTADPWADDSYYYYVKPGSGGVSGEEIIKRDKSTGREEVLVSYAGTGKSIASGLMTCSGGYAVYYLTARARGWDAQRGDRIAQWDLMCLDLQSGETRKIENIRSSSRFSAHLSYGYRPGVSDGLVSYIMADPAGAPHVEMQAVRLEDLAYVRESSSFSGGAMNIIRFFSSGRYIMCGMDSYVGLVDVKTGEVPDNSLFGSLVSSAGYWSQQQLAYRREIIPNGIRNCIAVVSDRYLIFINPDIGSGEIFVCDFLEGTVEATFPPPEYAEGGGWMEEFFYCEETEEVIFIYRDAPGTPGGQQQLYILHF